MIVINPMFLGPLRIVVFLLFLYVVNLLISKKSPHQFGLDYFIPRFAMCLSATIAVCFVLTQLNAFDMLICMGIFFVCLLYRFFNLDFKKPLEPQFQSIRRRLMLYLVIKFERNQPLISTKNLFKPTLHYNQSNSKTTSLRERRGILLLSIVLALGIFFSRYYFFKYDTYSLSDSWFTDLSNIKALTAQHWFFHDGTMMGENLVIHLYGTLTGISFPMALESFGLLETALLGIVIFWSLSKITGTHYIPGLIAALSFMSLYAFLPIDLNLLAQHKSVYLALSVALPTMLFCIHPKLLRNKKKPYFRWMLCLFFSLFFIDLIVALLLIPPFLIIVALLGAKDHPLFFKRAAIAYGIALISVFLLHLLAALVMHENLWYFINSNLFSVSAYTYSPQLIAPLAIVMNYYQWAALACLLLCIIMYIKNKSSWKTMLIFLAYSNVLFNINRLPGFIIDPDLLNQTLTVFIPLFFGIGMYMGLKIIGMALGNYSVTNRPLKISFPLIIIALLAFTTKNNANIPTKDSLKIEVLKAYDALDDALMPYSYSIVDRTSSKVLARDKHFFITYGYFNKDYLQKDLLFFNHKDQPAYLKNHPKLILPNSIFVFVYSIRKTGKHTAINQKEQADLKRSLAILKKRGRKVTVFFNSPLLRVYEIENKPKNSKLNDLLF